MKFKSNMWAAVEAKLAAGEDVPLYITGDGRLGLDGSANGATLPARLAAMVPTSLLARAQAKRAEVEAEEERKARQYAAELKAKRKAHYVRYADQFAKQGWLLLAGEDTKVVARGNFDEVDASLPLVTRCRRDPYEGKGCWVIIAPDGSEYAAGKFDREMYW